ncbi:MAG TPA: hypothetical protein VGO93_03120 [Candidatus Xenobia bacterium]|jgi:uncharacterized protein with von Willebrand factor type A (vWA) domain
MIVHRYSEYHEPEKPPFTVEDVIKAITEMMMRASMSFQEALQHLMRQGLSFRSFLQINGLDELIDKLVSQLEELKQKERERWDVNSLVEKKSKETQALQDELSKLLKQAKAGDAEGMLRQMLKDKNLYGLYKLKWMLTRKLGDKQAGKVEDQLEKLTRALEPLLSVQDLAKQQAFTGEEPISLPQALSLKERLEAIDQLMADLRTALENGDLESVNQKALEQMLGQAAAQAFGDKKDEIMSQFEQAMEGTGLVERDEDGLFKLTPGAARKLGEYFLSSVFSLLKSDGVGKHAATLAGEGAVETVSTRPLQYGDSITHIDMSGTFMNALVREGPGFPIKVRYDDFMVHETKGAARTAVVMMLDMSGSMARFGRFYNARKIAMALDALIRSQYPDDRLHFVGFYTMAKRYQIGDILNLQPKPVTFGGSTVRLRLDMSQPNALKGKRVPEYFTNIQKGLELSRLLLANEDTTNKSIIMITDGAPTAYYEGSFLNLCYPPDDRTFAVTLREVEKCTQDKIVISTFMMASDWDFGYHGEGEFLSKLVKLNKGRVFYPKPDSLTQYVMVDFLSEKRKLLQI